MNILITGVSGYVGAYLLREFTGSGHNIFGIYNSHPINAKYTEMIKCSLTNFKEVTKIFRSAKPDVVYHLASVTPTRITNEPDGYIELFNRGAAEHIAKLCAESGALMIFTSTDLVYADGENLTEEGARLNPLTIYAKTKLMGEDSVRAFAERYMILRFSLLYGFTISSYTSFFDVAYKTLKEGKDLKAFTDQYRKIFFVEDAARGLAQIPALYKKNDTINFCGDEYINRYDMCIKMADIFGLNKFLVKKASCDDFSAYPMVKNLGLVNDKMKKLGLKTSSYRENLRKSLKNLP